MTFSRGFLGGCSHSTLEIEQPERETKRSVHSWYLCTTFQEGFQSASPTPIEAGNCPSTRSTLEAPKFHPENTRTRSRWPVFDPPPESASISLSRFEAGRPVRLFGGETCLGMPRAIRCLPCGQGVLFHLAQWAQSVFLVNARGNPPPRKVGTG